MQNPSDDRDLKKFLQQVDDLESIVKDLNSDDPSLQKEAIKRADEKMKQSDKVGFDRSVINRKAYENDNNNEPNGGLRFSEPQTDQDAFLSALEADANKRAQARKERHRKATIIKDEGNVAFKNEDFQTAVELYSKAMSEAKDIAALYTNRAAAYIKLEKYQEAIDDCEFSLRVDKNWMKAFVFKARALEKLCKFDEAIGTIKQIHELEGRKNTKIEGFISEVNEARHVHDLQVKVQQNLKNKKEEAEGVVKTIGTIQSRLDSEREVGADLSGSLMYYAGGLRVLQAQLVDEESKMLFQTSGGFELLVQDGCISQCLMSRLRGRCTPPHGCDVVGAALSIATVAVAKSLQNLKYFLELPEIPETLYSCLTWPDEQVKRDIIGFFYESSLGPESRKIVYKLLDITCIFPHLLKTGTRRAESNSSASATLCNFTLDEKCKTLLEPSFGEGLLPIFEDCVKEIGPSDFEALTLRLRSLVQLLKNKAILKTCAFSPSFNAECMKALVRCGNLFRSGVNNPCGLEELLQVMGTTMRCNPFDGKEAVEQLVPFVLRCKHNSLLANCLNVMSAAVEQCEDFKFAKKALVKQLFKSVKNEDVQLRTYSLKILCFFGQKDPTLVKVIPSQDPGHKVLLSILSDKSSQIATLNQGHAALLVSALSACPGGLDQFDPGELVRQLLLNCRDSPDNTCKANCAIALGKLATIDDKYLVSLREHDGFNILAHNKPPDELL